MKNIQSYTKFNEAMSNSPSFEFVPISEIQQLADAQSRTVSSVDDGKILHVIENSLDFYDAIDDGSNGQLKAVVIQLKEPFPDEWDYIYQIPDEDDGIEEQYPKQFWIDVNDQIDAMSDSDRDKYVYDGEYSVNEQGGGGGIHLEDINGYHFMVAHFRSAPDAIQSQHRPSSPNRAPGGPRPFDDRLT